jgi:hypothetical protein
MDPFHDIQQQLFDAFDVGDELRTNFAAAPEEVNEEDDINGEEMSSRLDHLEELCRQATRPVYDGVNVSTIAATIVLINMAMIHGVSNAYMDKLIKYLSTVLLPRGNRLPRTHYAAKGWSRS